MRALISASVLYLPYINGKGSREVSAYSSQPPKAGYKNRTAERKRRRGTHLPENTPGGDGHSLVTGHGQDFPLEITGRKTPVALVCVGGRPDGTGDQHGLRNSQTTNCASPCARAYSLALTTSHAAVRRCRDDRRVHSTQDQREGKKIAQVSVESK